MASACQGTAQVVKDLITCQVSYVTSAERSKIHAGRDTFNAIQLPDNNILLCDNNQMIKLNEKLEFVEKLPVAGWPCSACLSRDGNHVYVVCDDNYVRSYTLQGQWNEVNKMRIKTEAWGILCYSDKIVTGHCSCIVIQDVTGAQISKVHKSGFSNYLALSHDHTMLYHYDGDDVVCRGMDDITQEIWRYSSPKLIAPRGLAVDNDGNVLIVGFRSRSVHQISQNGEHGRMLIDKLKFIRNPVGLFYNKNKNTFGVTSSYDDKVCVEVYAFEEYL